MFSEETKAKVYQARTGVILTKDRIPWYSVVGWFDSKKGQKITINKDWGWFTTHMSAPPKQGGGIASEPGQAHPGSAPRTIPKSEPTEEDTRVPREEARASREGQPQPPVWDNIDVFQRGRGVVEEKGYIPEGESDNLNRRLNEFLERQGRNQS
eukprot:61687-Amphidinium_carterae.4